MRKAHIVTTKRLFSAAILFGVMCGTALAQSSDPLVGNQWHLINTGQQVGNGTLQPIYGVAGEDINVAPVWTMIPARPFC